MPAGSLSREDVAARSGSTPELVDQLLDEGIIVAGGDGRLSIGDVRRVLIVRSMVEAGLPFRGIGEGLRRGIVSLDFIDSEEYDRFATLTSETFAQASARIDVPLEQLTLIREVIGAGVARPDDLVREDEQSVISFIELQRQAGFRPVAVERLLRTLADSLRRVAEAEADWWRTEVIEPNLAKGVPPSQIGGGTIARDLSASAERALIAVWHAQEAQTWTANIVLGFGRILDNAGLHQSNEREPAICFLDITGYTRLTQEQGDRAAAELAGSLNRLVMRTSQVHGGRPVKWLGDGVMCHFPDPGPGVVAALEMVDGIAGAGLPPAHVGLHSGPLVVQEGDYYGQTVNLAARIADYARPGEVLVSDAVVAATRTAAKPPELAFDDIGNVELKGVAGVVHLAAARRSASAG